MTPAQNLLAALRTGNSRRRELLAYRKSNGAWHNPTGAPMSAEERDEINARIRLLVLAWLRATVTTLAPQTGDQLWVHPDEYEAAYPPPPSWDAHADLFEFIRVRARPGLNLLDRATYDRIVYCQERL